MDEDKELTRLLKQEGEGLKWNDMIGHTLGEEHRS